MSGDKQYFVNRHGKKSGISGAVDEIIQTEPSTLDNPKKTTPQRRQRKMPSFRVSKKAVLICIAVLATLVAVLVVVADTVRRDLERDASRMETSVQEVASKTVSAETSAESATKGLLDQLDADTTCGSDFADVVRSLYIPAKNAYDDCMSNAMHYESLRTDLADLQQLANYLESQKTALSAATTPSVDGSFAVIDTQVTAWSDAHQRLQQLSPPDTVQSVYEDITQKAQVISEAWTKLRAANTDQNQNEFTEAESAISVGYESLRANGNELDAAVAQLQKSIDNSVSQLTRTNT